MKPFPTSAVAVQWHFRCHGSKLPDHSWTWLCRSKEGFVLAESNGSFRTLRDAVSDAESHGFVSGYAACKRHAHPSLSRRSR